MLKLFSYLDEDSMVAISVTDRVLLSKVDAIVKSLKPDQIKFFHDMSTRVKTLEAHLAQVQTEKEDVAARLYSAENVRDFLMEKLKDLEDTLANSMTMTAKKDEQAGLDREIIGFLDAKTQEYETALKEYAKQNDGLRMEIVHLREDYASKTTIIQDMVELLTDEKKELEAQSQRKILTPKDTDKSKEEDEDPSVEVVIDNDLATVGEGDKAPTYPHVLAMPAHRRPFFPGVVLPMTITNPEVTRALMALKESGQKYVGVFLKKSSGDPLKTGGQEDLVKNLSEIHHVGSFARIDNMLPFDANSVQVLMVSQRRIAIDDVRDEGPPLRVNISNLDNPSYDPKSKLIRAYSNEIVATLREIVKMNPLFKDHMQYFSQRIDIHNPYKLADFAASVTSADGEELQQVMEEMSCEARLKKALELITKELELSKVQQTIKEQVEEKISKNQRNYLLMEQLKAIKKELGMEKDDKDAMITKYRERLAQLEPGSIPESVNEVVEDELNKMSMLEKNSSEFNVTRNYLDWLTQLPWGKATEENFDLAKAKQILDEDHYGLKDIKERILEFIAVSKLKGDVQGKIICFVGPPGVGKTSIGKSIARSLNREFYRFSVGGLSDVAEIKGHRRTYVGAMPGKIIQCLKSTQSSNPLILIDEIDKLGRGYQGDPASALLELLDPSQNSGFVDHYMDVPVDLSRVLFICTANVTDTIPGPLLDRMEVLRLSGYDSPEKLAIAKEYLVPKALERTGLQKSETTPESLGLTDEAILTLVKQYCRESGVRNLEKHVEKVFRKVALEVVEDIESANGAQIQDTGESTTATKDMEEVSSDEDRFLITPDKLSKYVGKPIFTSDRMFEKQFPGVVMGLAWTAMGGASLYIETTKVETKADRSGLITTGQMGSVMEESTKIAHTYARSKMHQIDPESKFFEENEVHLHVPEGATPKDGPSAGCTMVTALLSLAMNKTVKPDLAMTGELSLVGKVLPVGGIKEKTIAAKRSGVKTLILPLGNQRDFEELEEYLRKDLDVHFADYYDDVYKVAFEQE
ncbi:hypothetical protein BBJ29_008857 [Phytophthora kernoviae]|uniref:Lon protease homolog, mitochondrial n=1 Tax=Phytophthora kernoviae TaxID=325452 RepID=A0A3R7GN67_9STRA|nr:hypothetical protein BBJ29_008857 [Phytophthora kernoviae]